MLADDQSKRLRRAGFVEVVVAVELVDVLAGAVAFAGGSVGLTLRLQQNSMSSYVLLSPEVRSHREVTIYRSDGGEYSSPSRLTSYTSRMPLATASSADIKDTFILL